jgi:hypothetical protein
MEEPSDDPRQRIRERVAEVREHLTAIEGAMGSPGGGDAMLHHLHQAEALLLPLGGEVLFLAMKLKGVVIQDGKMNREA